MLESGRTVFLVNKMSCPSKPVTDDWKKNEKHWISGKKEEQKNRNNSASPQKMELSTHNMSVFSKIEWIKISKGLKFH
jgi:hypothetical protein